MKEFDTESYVLQAAALAGLEIEPAHMPGVIENLQRSAAIARVFLDFPLPDDIEPAATYKP
jgi:hypothetical protein